MMKKENSKILLKIFELYESDFLTLSFQNNLKPYAKIKSIIKKGEDNFIIVGLEDSDYYLANCLIKKDLIEQKNVNKKNIILIKNVELVYNLNSNFYFILNDFDIMKDTEILDSSDPKKELKTPKNEVIILPNIEISFKSNKYYNNLKGKIKYDGDYFITNCFKIDNTIELCKYSGITFLGDEKDVFGKIIDKEKDTKSIILVNEEEIICSIKLNQEMYNKIQINSFYIFNCVKRIKDNNEDSDENMVYKYFVITNKTVLDNYSEKFSKMKEKIEKIAIIKFIIVDYNNNENNYFNKISIKQNAININKKIFYLCSSNNNLFSNYYLEQFILKNEKEKRNFSLFIYKNEITILNCFINNKNKNSKCYEIIYLSKKEKYLPDEFQLNDKDFISEYDTFDSKDRRRFNIMNYELKRDLGINSIDKNIDSLEIIFLINEKGSINKYGVFSVKSWNPIIFKDCIIPQDINKFLDEYYNKIEKNKSLINYYTIHNKEKLKLNNAQHQYILKVLDENKMNINFKETIEEFNYYKSIFLYNFIEKVESKQFIYSYFQLIETINSEKLSIQQSLKIRILYFFVRFTIKYKNIPLFCHIEDQDEKEYYKLAFKMQEDIINGFNENSVIFYSILQLNAYSLLKVDEKNIVKAYTISMERIDKMKEDLKLSQHKFFFKITHENKLPFLVTNTRNEGITCINDFAFLKGSVIGKDKDKAFAINIELTRERLGHGKEIINNTFSPKIYFDQNFEVNFIENINKEEGEPGIIIEKFIFDDNNIFLAKRLFVFGELLNPQYFIKENTDILNEKIKEIKMEIQSKMQISKPEIKKSLSKFQSKLIIFCLIFIIIYFSKGKKEIIKILSILILFALSIFSLIFLVNPTKKLNINIGHYLMNYQSNLDNKEEESNEDKSLIYPDDFIYTSSDNEQFKKYARNNIKSQKGQSVLDKLDLKKFLY